MASRVFVKVCGITSAADGALAAEAGADAVGFVFWPLSARRVDALNIVPHQKDVCVFP